MLNWASFWEAVGRRFSHRPGNPDAVGVVRWPSAGDAAGYRLCWPKLTPVSLISMYGTLCFYYMRMRFLCKVWVGKVYPNENLLNNLWCLRGKLYFSWRLNIIIVQCYRILVSKMGWEEGGHESE